MNRAHSVAGLLRSANGVTPLQISLSPLRHLLERMPFEALERENLARCVAQLQRTERDKEDRKIEYETDDHDEPAGSKSDSRAFLKDVPEQSAIVSCDGRDR